MIGIRNSRELERGAVVLHTGRPICEPLRARREFQPRQYVEGAGVRYRHSGKLKNVALVMPLRLVRKPSRRNDRQNRRPTRRPSTRDGRCCKAAAILVPEFHRNLHAPRASDSFCRWPATGPRVRNHGIFCEALPPQEAQSVASLLQAIGIHSNIPSSALCRLTDRVFSGILNTDLARFAACCLFLAK